MKEERILRVLGQVDEKYIAEAAPDKMKEKHMEESAFDKNDDIKKLRTNWKKWGVIAACICLLVAIPAVWSLADFGFVSDIWSLPETPSEIPSESPSDSPGRDDSDAEAQDGPPHIVLDDHIFYISSYLAVSDELPEGFTLSGKAEVVGMGECSYYLNPDIPEWVYVYHEVHTDGTVDAHGTLNATEPHNAYVRYVDASLRGKDLLSYDGKLYISMWSAQYSGEEPDVSRELYNSIQEKYDIRIEGEPPAGFVHVGTAEFAGHDTIPRSALASNQGEAEVYALPDDGDIILVSTDWYTATAEEGQETKHKGFNVYILYSGSLK